MDEKNQKRRKTYGDSGVSLEMADRIADGVGPLLARTFRKGCVPLPGGFAGLFDLKKEGLGDSILVLATDGVGTKIKLAIDHQQLQGLGIDLVAMSVNDLLTLGATPLCFLDYVAFGKIDHDVLMTLLKSIAAGCEQSGCALMGGETAEMPGMYQAGDFDLAGFCVGAVAHGKMVKGDQVRLGDSIIGIPSSGVHSNGYSLVRSIVADAPAEQVKERITALLKPTRIYAKEVASLMQDNLPRAMAHITGGGLCGNVTRVIPPGLNAAMRWGSWQVPELFGWLATQGEVPQAEMLNVFNMGIGYVVVCAKQDEAKVLKKLNGEATVIGSIETHRGSDPEMRATVE